jgi:hypothetical protein
MCSTNPTHYRLYMNTMKISISQKFYSAFYLWFYTLQVGQRGRTSRSPLIISLPAIYFVLPSNMSGRRCTRLQAHYCQSVAGCNSHDGWTLFQSLVRQILSYQALSLMDVLQTLVCDVTGIRHSVFITHQTSLGEVSGLFASRFSLSGVAPVILARMVI